MCELSLFLTSCRKRTGDWPPKAAVAADPFPSPPSSSIPSVPSISTKSCSISVALLAPSTLPTRQPVSVLLGSSPPAGSPSSSPSPTLSPSSSSPPPLGVLHPLIPRVEHVVGVLVKRHARIVVLKE